MFRVETSDRLTLQTPIALLIWALLAAILAVMAYAFQSDPDGPLTTSYIITGVFIILLVVVGVIMLFFHGIWDNHHARLSQPHDGNALGVLQKLPSRTIDLVQAGMSILSIKPYNYISTSAGDVYRGLTGHLSVEKQCEIARYALNSRAMYLILTLARSRITTRVTPSRPNFPPQSKPPRPLVPVNLNSDSACGVDKRRQNQRSVSTLPMAPSPIRVK